LGTIQKPIHIFGLRDRDVLQIWVSNDVFVDLQNPETIETPAGAALIINRTDRTQREIGVPLILREGHRDWVINLIKSISCIGKEKTECVG
jgi:hypothetical protein